MSFSNQLCPAQVPVLWSGVSPRRPPGSVRGERHHWTTGLLVPVGPLQGHKGQAKGGQVPKDWDCL